MSVTFLESFDVAPAPEGPRMVPETELEEARQQGRDEGYHAGWAAATEAAEADQSRLDGALVAAVTDLGFTYQEARAHVMRGIEPVLQELLDAVLPAVLTEALGRTVLDELQAMAADAADQPILLSAAPTQSAALRTHLPEDMSVPLRVVEDPSLDPGQATLRLGTRERMVDLAGVLSRLTAALGAVTDLNERTLAHA